MKAIEKIKAGNIDLSEDEIIEFIEGVWIRLICLLTPGEA